MMPTETLRAVDDLLGTATQLAETLGREGVLHRLATLLGSMLPEDREPVLDILEQDGATIAWLESGNLWARVHLRPNPLAQLFTRSHAGGPAPAVRYLDTRRNISLGMRVLRDLPPAPAGGWEPESAAAWRRLTPDERAYARDVSRRILATLAAARSPSSDM